MSKEPVITHFISSLKDVSHHVSIYGLVDGKLDVTVKKALIMYFLMDWSIAPYGEDHLPPTLFPLAVESIVDAD